MRNVFVSVLEQYRNVRPLLYDRVSGVDLLTTQLLMTFASFDIEHSNHPDIHVMLEMIIR